MMKIIYLWAMMLLLPATSVAQERQPSVAWTFGAHGFVSKAPTITDSLIYFSADYEDHWGYVYALSRTTGEERWRFELLGDGWLSRPVVDNGILYVGSGCCVYAVDATTGRQRWKFEPPDEYRFLAPAVGEQQVLVGGSSGTLYVLDITSGRVSATLRTRRAGRPAEGEFDEGGFRVVVAGPNAYFGSYHVDGTTLYAIDVATAEQRWTREIDRASGIGAATEDAVYVGASGQVIAYSARSGEERWRFGGRGKLVPVDGSVFVVDWRGVAHLAAATGSPRGSAPVDGYIIGHTVDGGMVTLLGVRDGVVFCLDAATHDVLWQLPMEDIPQNLWRANLPSGAVTDSLAIVGIDQRNPPVVNPSGVMARVYAIVVSTRE